MNKFKIIATAFLSLSLCSYFAVKAVKVNKAYAVVGESYASMVGKYGQPESVPLNRAVSSKNLQRYQAGGISVAGYKFQVNGFKMTALFNKNNICYEMKTYNNRSLPDPKYLIGSLARTKPVVLSRIPFRAIILQYGTGANAVIYKTFGFPGDLSAISYSPALKP